jgi:hypothetical protein
MYDQYHKSGWQATWKAEGRGGTARAPETPLPQCWPFAPERSQRLHSSGRRQGTDSPC